MNLNEKQIKNSPETISAMEMLAIQLGSTTEIQKQEELTDELEYNPLNPILYSTNEQISETGKRLFKYLCDKRLLGALAEHMRISRELKLSRIELLDYTPERSYMHFPRQVLGPHGWIYNQHTVDIPYNRYIYTVKTTINIGGSIRFSYETELFFHKHEYHVDFFSHNREIPNLVTGFNKLNVFTEEMAQTFKVSQWAEYKNTYAPHNGDLKCGARMCPSTIFHYDCQKCSYNLNNNHPTKIYTKIGCGPTYISIPGFFTGCLKSNMPRWYLPTILEELFVDDFEFIEHFSKNFNQILPLLRIFAEDIKAKEVEADILTKISARNTRLQEAMKLFKNNFLNQRKQVLSENGAIMCKITDNNPYNIVIDKLKDKLGSLSESFHCILLYGEDEKEYFYLNKWLNEIKNKITEYKSIHSDIPIDPEYFIMKDIEAATVVINDLIKHIEENKTLCNMSLDIKKAENLNDSVSNIMENYKEHRKEWEYNEEFAKETFEKMICLLDQIEAIINKYFPEILNPTNVSHIQQNKKKVRIK